MKEVTVILPLYNEKEDYAVLAIESILNQTFQNYDFYIILDNPENRELQILLERYERKEPKISFFINKENMGLPDTLNRMIDMVETEFIARMDGDDISFSKRLEVQRDFMITHPDIDLCSVNIQYMDIDGNLLQKKERLPERPKDINKCLAFLDVLVHPGFFVKTSVLKKMKYRNLKYAQDYDLVCRMAEGGYQLANINRYLLYYRIGGNTERKIMEQHEIAKIICTYYRKNKLSSLDIEREVQTALAKIKHRDVKKYMISGKYYNKGVSYWKQGNRVQGMLFIIQGTFLSKMRKDDFTRALKYKIYMKTHSEYSLGVKEK